VIMPYTPFPTLRTTGNQCDHCSRIKNIFVTDEGEEIEYCPTCSDVSLEDLSTSVEYRCQVCDEVRSDCVGHHASYAPEEVVPVCLSCHAKLHSVSGFADELTPDLSRLEAEERGLISIRGLDEKWEV